MAYEIDPILGQEVKRAPSLPFSHDGSSGLGIVIPILLKAGKNVNQKQSLLCCHLNMQCPVAAPQPLPRSTGPVDLCPR